MIKPIKKLRFLNREKAQTMVEFALVFPIVLLITYGIIEFGRMIFIYSAVTSAAREGARYGIATRDIGGVPQYADCQGIRDSVGKTAFLVSITDIDIKYDDGTSIISTSCDILNPNDIKLGDRIIVTVTAQYDPVIGGFLGVGGFTMTGKNYRTILMNIGQ